jgi:hypothetical protein
VHEVLTKSGRFEIKDEHFLINARATSQNIRQAISDLFWEREEKCQTCVFYFAGHAKFDHMDYGYLFPHDVNVASPFVKGICIQELKRLFIDSKANTSAIMILDCCYSGIATGARSGGADQADATKSLGDVLRLDNTGSGRFILASARADEKAREKKQKHIQGSDEEHVHGLYSFHLIEALRGAAADKKGYVSLGRVIRHIDNVFRNNNPDVIPPIYAAGQDMDCIWLTEISERVTESLKRQYELIETLISKQTSRDLLCAVEAIIDLQDRGVSDEGNLANCLKRIDEGLKKEFKDKCEQWWFENSSMLYRDLTELKTDKVGQFNLLKILLKDLTVENYRKHDLRTRGFLTEFIEGITEDKDYRSVTKHLRDEKPAPRIGSESNA